MQGHGHGNQPTLFSPSRRGSESLRSSKMPNPRFCPTPNRYAVIRIDPVACVQHLRDPEASAAAANIKTKSYLVLVGIVCGSVGPLPSHFSLKRS